MHDESARPQVRCRICRRTDGLQMAMWVDPNTGELKEDFGSFGEPDSQWCENCQQHGTLISVEDQVLAQMIHEGKEDA